MDENEERGNELMMGNTLVERGQRMMLLRRRLLLLDLDAKDHNHLRALNELQVPENHEHINLQPPYKAVRRQQWALRRFLDLEHSLGKTAQ